jgi:hypothetical protein
MLNEVVGTLVLLAAVGKAEGVEKALIARAGTGYADALGPD